MLGPKATKNCLENLATNENGNWSSFQLANSAPPLSVTGSAIAPSARMLMRVHHERRLALGQDDVDVRL